MKTITSLFAFLTLSFSVNAQMVHEFEYSLFTKQITLTRAQSIRLETRNSTVGCDPVLNLIGPSGLEVSRNDNGNGQSNARIRFTTAVAGNYTIILRAKNTNTTGKTDLFIDQALSDAQVTVGGNPVMMNNIRKDEELRTVKLPNGNTGIHTLYILKSNEVDIDKIISIRFPDGCVNWIVSPAMGNRRVFIGSSFPNGYIRLVRNDAKIAGHDTDNDGLGRELENEIGTCTQLNGFANNFDCSTATDARDTDGDGIPDGWEFLGRYDMLPHQTLPKWGANPRHKDLFIEVDFMRRNLQENQSNTQLKMYPNVAQRFAAIYGDSFTTSNLLKLYHAVTLKNPDKLPGISVHLDIGLDPTNPEDATIYGNWGGYNGVDAVQKDGNWIGVESKEAWKTNLTKSRLGIFRYALGFSGGGSQCGPGFSCAFNFHDQVIPAHEWGHTLSLGHSGPMGGGDADPNCMPNYPSIMNYAYMNIPDVGFSDGYGIPAINNASVMERNFISPSKRAVLDVLSTRFGYWVDYEEGHVDWNRNGIFESSKVKSYVNYRPANSCEYTRYNQLKIPDTYTTTTPIMARLGNRLYVFFAQDGLLKYKYTSAALNCPEPESENCGNVQWSATLDGGMQAVGVDVVKENNVLRVVTINWQGQIKERVLALEAAGIESWSVTQNIGSSASMEPSLTHSALGTFLIYRGTDNFIHFRKRVNGVWQADQIANKGPNDPIKTSYEWVFPSSIHMQLPWNPDGPGLYALFAATDRNLDLWYYNSASNFWEKTNLLEGSRPGPIHGKPALTFVPDPGIPEYPGKLYMVYCKKSDVTGVEFKGPTKMRMSYIKVEANDDNTLDKSVKIGLDAYFDNVWFYAYSISLFYDKDYDTNLRAVYSRWKEEDNQFSIYLRPKADGINNYLYRNSNDWEQLGKNLCKRVANPTGDLPSSIICPD